VKPARASRFPLHTILFALAVLAAACGPGEPPPPTPTYTPAFITATLPPTLTPRPSPTLAPPTNTPPVTPVEGQTTAQLNVRSAPSAASENLGTVTIFSRVQIVGKDADGKWWMILFPEGPNGVGWITAEYVQVSGEPDVPVIGAAAPAPGAPPAGSSTSASATVIETVNVRSGPGTNYNAVGTVEAGSQVTLTAKDPNGAWLQIAFPAGPEGKGWINAAFLRAEGVESLPIITASGQVIGTGTPAPLPAGPTSTVVAAIPDDDSAAAPAVSLTLSQVELRSFSYSSDLSTPQGDAEDWVAFVIGGPSGTPETVSAVFECAGNSPLNIELLQNTSRLQTWQDVSCEGRKQLILNLFAGAPYTLHLLPSQGGGGLNYVAYTLIVSLR
jgi:uncharacterized protein YraI